MQNSQNQVLDKLYSNLLNIIERDRSIKKKSALLTLIDIKSNARIQYLRDAALPTYKILSDEIKTMSDNGLIRETDIVGSYTLTAQGIWNIELKKGLIDEKKFIEFFDEKFFNPFKYADQLLSDKFKVILFFMIAARSFSEDSSIDLHISKTKLDVIQSTMNETFDILKSIGAIKSLSKENLFGKKGNEHPVSQLIRHSDKLPKQTKNIFKTLGNQKYCLEIFNHNRIQESQLSFIFKKIFENYVISVQNLEIIRSFLDEIAHSKSIYFYNDIKKHSFSNIEYDEIIKNALLLGCKIEYSQ